MDITNYKTTTWRSFCAATEDERKPVNDGGTYITDDSGAASRFGSASDHTPLWLLSTYFQSSVRTHKTSNEQCQRCARTSQQPPSPGGKSTNDTFLGPPAAGVPPPPVSLKRRDRRDYTSVNMNTVHRGWGWGDEPRGKWRKNTSNTKIVYQWCKNTGDEKF